MEPETNEITRPEQTQDGEWATETSAGISTKARAPKKILIEQNLVPSEPDKLSGQVPERQKTESCDLAIQSIDSAFAKLSSLQVLPAHSDNDTMESISALSRNSSLATSVSESFVDAEKAGIIGGLYEGAINVQSNTHQESTTSLPSLKSAVTAPLHGSNIKSAGKTLPSVRRSTLTDPGVIPEADSLRHGRNPSSYGRAIGEDHANFVLMYDMLTGIRHSVSVCQAKPSRPLTSEDFSYARTYNFLQSSNEITPSKYEFRFKDYCPWIFRSLREAFKIDAADYLVSLTGKYALSEIGSPGKSGSFFYFSQDFRYIIKTIRQSEHVFLRKILRHYFDHIKRNPNSLLTRFYGLHRVRMSNIRKIYFVVMGNIFPPHKDIHETYDLKGSSLGRFITPEESSNKHLATLKDLNWLQLKRKLKLGPEKATMLMNQLRADCMFLSKMRIMDYSLLVGIHYSSRGNWENLRERSMMILEPATPISTNENQKNSKGTPPTFRQTSITAVDSSIPLERKMCAFYSEDGGYSSSHKDGTPGDELYFLGVIDILTPYSVVKRLEHVIKSIQHDRRAISAVNPMAYCKRFLNFMSENILQDTAADYASKNLPDIPYPGEGEGIRIVMMQK